MTPRFPDFVVIGAAKSGTTSLDKWLGRQPDVYMCYPKEPRFFSHRWERGIDWYASLFDRVDGEARVGEATPKYTRVEHSDVSAERMAKVIPDADLVYVVRHPIERLVSDYRHHVRRGQLHKPFLEVLRDPSNPLVGTSCYFARLAPYIERYGRERIAVVRFEDLVEPDGDGWKQVLDHLGLPFRERPVDAHNVTDELPQRASIVGRLSTARRRWNLPDPPRWVKRANRRLSDITSREYRDPLRGDVAGPPDDVLAEIWADIDRFEDWVGRGPLWARDAPS